MNLKSHKTKYDVAYFTETDAGKDFINIKNMSSVNHKCRLAISIDRNNIHLSSVYMRVEAYMYFIFIRVMLSDQKRFRLLHFVFFCFFLVYKKERTIPYNAQMGSRRLIFSWNCNVCTISFVQFLK